LLLYSLGRYSEGFEVSAFSASNSQLFISLSFQDFVLIRKEVV
jgi:hypothetical protein